MNILTQKISNHNLFTDIKREVIVNKFSVDTKFNQLILEIKINYFDKNNKDVTKNFSQPKNIILSNSDFRLVDLDEDNQPRKNPDYKEIGTGEDNRLPNEKIMYLSIGILEYFNKIFNGKIKRNINDVIKDIINSYDNKKIF